MATLPPYRQIQFSQLVGAPPWFAPVVDVVNRFLGPVYDAITQANAAQANKTLTVAVAGDGTFAAQSITVGPKARPLAVLIAQITLKSGTPSSKPAIGLNQWSVNSGKVQLDALVGLQPGCTYDITFLILM